MAKCKDLYNKEKEKNSSHFSPGHIPWNKGKKMGAPWNKGLTKETDDRVANNAVSVQRTMIKRGIKPVITKEGRQKISESKKGERNPTKRPEVREKIRQSITKYYKEHPEALVNRKPCGINQYSDNYTSLEKPIADEINRLGLVFYHNYRCNRFFIDFRILNNIAIECDGEYWHQDKEKEQRRNKVLHDKGYYVFHLTEQQILTSPKKCVKTILSIMYNLNQIPPSIFKRIRQYYHSN